MSYPGGDLRAPLRWPIRSDVAPIRPRPAIAAAVLLLLGGAAGVVQLVVGWSSDAGAQGVRPTGWQEFKLTRSAGPLGPSYTLSAYTLLAVAITGIVLGLIGLAVLLPIDHRPLAGTALVAGLIGLGCALFWLASGPTGRGEWARLGGTFGVGWYLFLASGLLGVIGAIAALARARQPLPTG